MTAPKANESMNLQTVTRVLRQRMGVILASVMVFTMLGVLINTLTPPVYRATTRIEIRRTAENSNNFQSENMGMFTAAALITNRALLGQIVDEFDRRGWIRGGSGPDEMWRTAVAWMRQAHIPIAEPAPPPPDPTRRSKEIDWLETAVVVEPLRDTRLVDIHVEHTNPDAARTIADRLTQRFTEYQTLRTNGPDSVRTAGAAQLASESRGTPIASGAGTMGRAWNRARLHALDGQVSNTQSEYYRVRSERADAASKLSQLERYASDGSIDLTQLPIDDSAIDAMRRDVAACQTRLASAKQVYRDHHPQLTEISNECAALRAGLRRELQRAVQEKRAQLAMLSSREADLRSTLSSSTVAMGAAEVQQEAEQQQLGGANPIPAWIPPVEIVDPATVAPQPVRPRKLVNLAICAAIGLMAGIGIALLKHSMRHTIRTPEDVEAELGLEVLGVIPKKSLAPSW